MSSTILPYEYKYATSWTRKEKINRLPHSLCLLTPPSSSREHNSPSPAIYLLSPLHPRRRRPTYAAPCLHAAVLDECVIPAAGLHHFALPAAVAVTSRRRHAPANSLWLVAIPVAGEAEEASDTR